MSARLNLAPELYQHDQADKHKKQVATTIGVTISAIAVGLTIFGAVVVGGQAISISAMNSNIDKSEKEIKGMPDLQKAATFEKHLETLDNLTNQKYYLNNFFITLQNFAPQGIAATQLDLDPTNNVTFTGQTQSYNLVTKFARALEGANVTNGQNAAASNTPFYTNVNILKVEDDGNGGLTFKLTAQVGDEVTSNASK